MRIPRKAHQPQTAPEPDVVRKPGPWRHRTISTNGIHLHVADRLPDNWEEISAPGELPPLVLFLHGYCENWWVWKDFLNATADAGYHAVAVDMRGYGDSDKPPRGYDVITAAKDLGGLVRATGHRDAIIVAHGIGAVIAWTMARIYPRGVKQLITVATPHPRVFLRQLYRHPFATGHMTVPLLWAQLPRIPEKSLQAREWMEKYLTERTAENWVATPAGQEAVDVLNEALTILKAAHCANEYLRWIGRSRLRTDGWRYLLSMKRHLDVPVVSIRGSLDTLTDESSLLSGARYSQSLRIVTIADTKYFPHLENPTAFRNALVEILTNN